MTTNITAVQNFDVIIMGLIIMESQQCHSIAQPYTAVLLEKVYTSATVVCSEYINSSV